MIVKTQNKVIILSPQSINYVRDNKEEVLRIAILQDEKGDLHKIPFARTAMKTIDEMKKDNLKIAKSVTLNISTYKDKTNVKFYDYEV